ncbi:MAG: MFS transporter [Abditibacteriales bacterium]|nr:MFS transporter [Abditibacteriales bacterium]
MANASAGKISAWSPLRQPLFRALWLASVIGDVGTWMHNVGAVWLMTSLAPSADMVALVQAASALPIFLLALLAGALADVVDRRRLLLFTQGWMLVAAAALGVLTLIGTITPWVLLALTFVLGIGAAMSAPAWQAIAPELVSRQELSAAVALRGVGFNLARAVGPALGGIVIAAAGAGITFLINAASFLGVMIVLCCWHRPPHESVLPAERVMGAMQAGVRYVRHAPALRAVLVRAGVFVVAGSALWALLPIVVRSELKLDVMGYGVLLGSLGVGTIAGAAFLPKVQRKLAVDWLVASATVLFAAVMLTLAYVRHFAWLCAVMIVGGAAWIALMSSLNVAAQTSVPSWVRARALAVYLLVFQGGMAAGSILWGAVAARGGISFSLLCAAIGLVAGLATITRYRLTSAQTDLTPSMHWQEPVVVSPFNLEQGPVLVIIAYRIDPARAHDFVLAMRDLRLERLRDGAIRWDLFRDAADPGRYVETFILESWVEHLRQHERVTVADRAVQERVHTFHVGDTPPTVSHLLSVNERIAKGELT